MKDKNKLCDWIFGIKIQKTKNGMYLVPEWLDKKPEKRSRK